MRYIGNKTRLLPFILGTLDRLGIEAGSAHDAFSGTSAVGRALRERGWRVASSDLMTYAYVLQRAYVVARPGSGLDQMAAHLSRGVRPERGFVTSHYSPVGGRMFFTEENAARIDAARRLLHEWRLAGRVDDDAFYLLLAALIEGADRVANTAGVYAAFIKTWQSNARRPFALDPVVPARGPRGAAHQDDAARVARALGAVDLLYIDPPYNARQYSGYYHVPEILARGWFDGVPRVAGTAGLPAERTAPSAWCSARRVPHALAELLAASGARHVLVSYNSEGLLEPEALIRILGERSVDGTVRRFSRVYPRYRADGPSAPRRYREGKLRELLYYARLR